MSRIEIPRGDKGNPSALSAFENQTPSNIKGATYYLASSLRTKVPGRRSSRDDASPLFAPVGTNGGKFNPATRARKTCPVYGRESGVFLSHSNLGGYKMMRSIEVSLTVQRFASSLIPYARFPRHQSQDRHVPSVHISLSRNNQYDLCHNERPTKYPLEFFDRCPLGHCNIGLVTELGKMGEVLTP